MAGDETPGVSVRRYDVAGNPVGATISLSAPAAAGHALGLAGNGSGHLALLSSRREWYNGHRVYGQLLDLPSNVR